MKPSANTVLGTLIVRPVLGGLARALGAHGADLVEVFQRWRERRAQARIAQVKVWMDREIAYHDDHLLALDAELTICERKLQELRMHHRKANLLRRGIA